MARSLRESIASRDNLLRLLRVFTGLLSGRVLSAGLQAVTLVFLARGLTPTEFAFVGTILGVSIFLTAVADMGVSTAVTRETARGNHAAVDSLLGLNRLLSLGVAGVGAAACLLAGLVVGGTIAWQLVPLGIWLGAERLAETAAAVHVGNKRARAAASSIVIRKSGPLAGSALAFWLAPPLLVLGLSMGYLFGAIAAYFVTKERRVDTVDIDRLGRGRIRRRQALSLALPFWVNSMAAQSRQLDVLVVGMVGGGGAAVAYAPASRLISPLRMIPTTLAQALLPFVAERDPRRLRLGRVVLATLLASGGLFAVLYLLAAPLTLILFGQKYVATVPILRILIAGLTFAALASVLNSVAQGSGLEKSVALISTVSAVLTLAAIGIGTALGGAQGAAYGIVVIYVAQSAALAMALRLQVERAPTAGLPVAIAVAEE